MKKTSLIIFLLMSLISFVSAHTGNDAVDHCSGFCPMLSGMYGAGWMWVGWLLVVVSVLFVIWLGKLICKK